MGLFKIWKDHVTQYSNRYREVQNADGTITHEDALDRFRGNGHGILLR